MPQLSDITNQDLSSYVHTSSVNSAAVPPTVPATNMEPGLNKYLRCPLPPVWQSSPDSIRQFYNNNQVPQVRIFNPSTPQNVVQPPATAITVPVTTVSNVSNITNNTIAVVDVTQSVVTGTRTLAYVTDPDTTPPTGTDIYHNTGTTARMVTVSADLGGGGFHGVVYCDSAASPTTQTAQFSRVNAGSSAPNYYPGSVTFMVPAGYYYGISVTNGAGSPFIRTWTEWQF